MGVLGLNPFLQKVCPDVFKSLPSRFKSLSGKKIVFDGTLITQRLHFAPMPHRYRHVLGWYRIIQELNESSVLAVCIFDGKGRNAAKQGEVHRRREVRRTLTSRGQLEKTRLIRLRRIMPIVKALHHLSHEERIEVLEGFRSSLHASNFQVASEPLLPIHAAVTWDLALPENIPREESTTDYQSGSQQHDAYSTVYGAFHEPDLVEIMLRDPSLAVDPSRAEYAEPGHVSEVPFMTSDLEYANSGESGDMSVQIRAEDADGVHESLGIVGETDGFATEPSVIQQYPGAETTVDSMKSTLAHLYVWYKASMDNLDSSAHGNVPPLPSLTFGEDAADSADSRAEHMMLSKAQQELATAEGILWQQLLRLESLSLDVVERTATVLAEKSQILSESYDRRTLAPTTATYEQSKEILRALGVLCLETNGPHEAEAVAAAMVLQGQADYVASEDTDVLIYGAPLIRNITTKAEPLVTVSGTDVRRSLHLDQSRFIDFALLLGTDFSQRIKNVGPARALKFIQEHGSIERIIEHEKEYPPRQPICSYLQQVALARMVFQTLPPVPCEDLTPPPVDEEAVLEIMHRYQLWRSMSKEHQWFDGGALAGNYFSDSPFAS
ncbi:PIN domain-like protein [Cytidiella melzeri]|nr:PIN domain-like protein [Cytidiella melzeri]